MEASASRPTVGVTGADAAAAATTLRDADLDATVGTPAAVLDADPAVCCALGTEALTEIAATGRTPGPVLVVDGPRGTPTIPRSALPDAATRLAAAFADGPDAAAAPAGAREGLQTRSVPVLSVTVGDRTERAVLECSLLATPIGMSEFAVVAGADGPSAPGSDAGRAPEPVDRFRADGVVIATPAGSQGYAGNAGGPALGPEVAATSVVPVAPFAIDRERSVVRPPLTVRVLRAANEVTMVVDGRRAGPVTPAAPVTIAVDGELDLLVLPDSRPHFRRAGRLEKT